jgi:hypothetical protein
MMLLLMPALLAEVGRAERSHVDKDALTKAVAAASDKYDMRYVDVLDMLTDVLGYGDTGIQDKVPEDTTIKEVQEAFVELLEKALGRIGR